MFRNRLFLEQGLLGEAWVRAILKEGWLPGRLNDFWKDQGGIMDPRWMTLVLALVVLATADGCTTGSSSRLSSLGREVDVTPLRGQSAAQLQRDDAECTTWTRTTKGPNEPFEYAELRYASCVAVRGYGATIGGVRLSSPQERTLEVVIADWRGCRVDKLIQEVGFDKGRREQALACLKGRGYLM
jgi:hypothetical protein